MITSSRAVLATLLLSSLACTADPSSPTYIPPERELSSIPPHQIHSVWFQAPPQTMWVGESVNLEVNTQPTHGRAASGVDAIWSSDTTVASFTALYRLTAHARGAVTITARSGAAERSIRITVR